MIKEEEQMLLNFCESKDWWLHGNEQDGHIVWEIGKPSPLGEDFFFIVWADTVEEFVREVRSYADDFDPQAHAREIIQARERGFGGVPSDDRVLYDDADEIDEMLSNLADDLQDWYNHKDDEDDLGFFCPIDQECPHAEGCVHAFDTERFEDCVSGVEVVDKSENK